MKRLLDNNFHNVWKTIELSFLAKFHREVDILWKTYAPESILKSLGCTQLSDSLRTWYIFREQASKDIFDFKFSEFGACQSLWFNRQIRSKSKQFLYYETWYNKNVHTISDLLNPPLPGYKLFEELVLDFYIPLSDRRKYNFLMKNVPQEWLENSHDQNMDIIDTLIAKLVNTKKVPTYAYNILLDKCAPDKRYNYWSDKLAIPHDINWENVHVKNFRCSIDTRLRSFYFKLFHNAIALNAFLYKIKRKDSPNCIFCNKEEETMVHIFCECEKIAPIWHDLLSLIHQKYDSNLILTNFTKFFGIPSNTFLSYLFLLLKYFIYVCKFKSITPNFIAFKSFVKTQKEVEYYIAKKRNKLSTHFKKWRFEL